MWGGLHGEFCSSTRTELAAAVMALLQPVPLHIASDSLGMITKGLKLIHTARQRVERKDRYQWTL